MKKGFIIPLIIVIIAVAALVGVFYLGKKSSGPTATNPVITQQASPLPSLTPDETANWKTYTNTKLNFSFKYPPYTSVSNAIDDIRGQFISLQGNDLNFDVNIEYLNSGPPDSDLGYTKAEKLVVNGNEWQLLIPQSVSGYLYKTNIKTYRVTYNFKGSSQPKDTLVKQLLSTFKFTQ